MLVALVVSSRRVRTRAPTHAPSACALLDTQEQCQEVRAVCKWYVMEPCNHLHKPVTCKRYEYGCRGWRDFCEFTQGDALDRQSQCNYRGFPCMWNGSTCVRTTRRPSPQYPPPAGCYDLCLPKVNNGVCDDGGEGSQTSWCLLGTDCRDCGERH